MTRRLICSALVMLTLAISSFGSVNGNVTLTGLVRNPTGNVDEFIVVACVLGAVLVLALAIKGDIHFRLSREEIALEAKEKRVGGTKVAKRVKKPKGKVTPLL
jgi:hypothetical protein